MSYRAPLPPPLSVEDANTRFREALAAALQEAITAGAKGQGATLAAKRACERVSVALNEVRRAERAAARQLSINALRADLGVAKHSANVRGPGAIDWPKEIDEALAQLGNATW